MSVSCVKLQSEVILDISSQFVFSLGPSLLESLRGVFMEIIVELLLNFL